MSRRVASAAGLAQATHRRFSVRVWDLPTRIFHWALAFCVIASIVSARVGGNAMVWHFRLGYAVLTMLAFRLVWGGVGGRWSRFTSFVFHPATTLRYLRGQSRPDEHHQVGHNPLGALSVFTLLAILIAQVGTGLFADDEISNTGPLVRFVSGATSSALTHWHRGDGQWLVIGLGVLHVAAVAFYVWRRKQGLLRAMWIGDKMLAVDAPGSVDTARSRWLALAIVAVCGAAVAWLVSLRE